MAVVVSRDPDCFGLLARLPARPDHCQVTLTPRGGGTGSGGTSLTAGLVLGRSRSMARVLSADSASRRAPDLATSNRATNGRITAAAPCVQGACLHGKLSALVRHLRLPLGDRSGHWSTPVDDPRAAVLATDCSCRARTGLAANRRQHPLEIPAPAFPIPNR